MTPYGEEVFYCGCAHCIHGKVRSSCKTAFNRPLKKKVRREAKEEIEKELKDAVYNDSERLQ